MKRILPYCGIITFFLLQTSLLTADIFNSTVKNLSILGNKNNVQNYIVGLSTPDNLPQTIVSSMTESETSPIISTVTAQSEAGKELVDFIAQTNIFCFTNDQWICLRREKEGAISQEEVVVSTMARRAPAPLPPGLSVELPYESQLSISGRKTIGVSMKVLTYDQPNPTSRPNPAPTFDMTQQLDVRIKGQVGHKINVNVDFDDSTADKRDISVAYKGDKDEVIQSAAFGDIAMSLPQTEFVGYSKQLFGVEVNAKYKKLQSWGFFSRTKGNSEVKRFTGNTQLVRMEIPDTGYIPMKYYSFLANPNDVVINGSIKVYLDNRNQATYNINTTTITVETLTSPATYYTGNFNLQVPGQDYTVDYTRGIIIFLKKLSANYVAAVDYQRSDKTWLSSTTGTINAPKIIKYDDSIFLGLSSELKTFYSFGNVKIVRDDGRGNFILRVVDLGDNTPTSIQPGGKSVPVYPNNTTVDFDNGVFNFEPATARPFPDSVYNTGTHSYNILTEYSYRIKIITLRPGIVPKSEKVTMDGRILKANDDYYIDYDAGLVTFFNVDKITESTVIEISYDFAPFGGAGGSTLIGLRSELSLTKNVFVGGSYIYQMDAQAQTVPDIRNAPTSLTVMETDGRITDMKLPHTPLLMSLGVEYAQSSQNPNIADGGRAMVESMQGIKQADSASINYLKWQPGSTPSGTKYYATDISWLNENVPLSDITSNLQPVNNQQVMVLDFDYNLSRSNELSIVQPLSNVGLDFATKIYMEMWIWGDGAGEELQIDYGQFNEKVDSDNNTIPKTEDLAHTGSLTQGEDIGWPFVNPDGSITRIGAGNGQVDSEDLDGNGILTTYDTVAGSYGANSASGGLTDSTGKTHTAVDWRGWKYFTVPMNIVDPTQWQAIKQVRVTVRKVGGTQMISNPKIKIYTLSAVSNKWQPAMPNLLPGTTLSILALDRNSDEYVSQSLVFNSTYQSLYGITSNSNIASMNEQTLDLVYTVANSTGDEVAAVETYTTPLDLSNYKELHFFVYGKPSNQGDTFFLQAGDNTDYYEYSRPIYWTGWKELVIYQYDITKKNNQPQTWAVSSGGATSDSSGARTIVVGNPSFLGIGQFRTGVRTTGPKTNGEVWLDCIFAANPYIKTGGAEKLSLGFKLPGWAELGGTRKQVDRNFQTFSAGVYNRDLLQDSAYLNFSKLSLMPISAKLDHSVTVTPAVVQNQGNLVSILDQGKVITYNGSVNTSLNIARALPTVGRLLPVFGFQASRAITDTQDIQRLQDDQTAAGTMEYAFPIKFFLFPTNISANYSVTNSYFRLYPSTAIADSTDFLDLNAFNKYFGLSAAPGYDPNNYHTLDTTRSYGIKAPFRIFSLLSFSPNYSFSQTTEKNRDFAQELDYDKNDSQTIGANSTLSLAKWFQPSINYSENTKETYNLIYSTDDPVNPPTYPGQTKYIERSDAGEASWNFQVKDIFKYKYTQSLGFSSSYRIQDSDSYNNIVSSFNPLGLYGSRLWLRGNSLANEIAGFQTSSFSVVSQDYKQDVRVAGRYNPFEAFNIYGRLAPIKTLTTNFTYTGSHEDSNSLGTERVTNTMVWPDILLGLGQVEKMIWLERWVTNSQLNLKEQIKTSVVENYTSNYSSSYGADIRFMLLKKYDMSFSMSDAWNSARDLVQNLTTSSGRTSAWSGQGGVDFKPWRFTLRYDNSLNAQSDGTGKLTTDLLTETYTFQVYADMSFPKGLPIPFTNKKLNLTNRFIFNAALKYIEKSSSLNVTTDNTSTFSLTSSAQYEVSQNFRLTIGLGITRMVNRDATGVDNNSYTEYDMNSGLAIQF